MNEQPVQTKKSNNTVTIIIIVVAVLAVLGIGGYFASRYMAQKASEALLTAATGGKVKTAGDDSASLNLGNETVKTGSLAQWPTDLPIALKSPELVTIKAVVKNASAQIWTITIGDIPTNEIDNYIYDLKQEGWTVSLENDVIVKITELTKENWKINITYDEPNRGALLTVSPK